MNRDRITERRHRLWSAAALRIGLEESEHGGRRLRLDAIAEYLHSIGCPLQLDTPLELSSLPSGLRDDVDQAAKEMRLPSTAGILLYSDVANYPTAVSYAAIVASEFLRRQRCVAWHSVEEIFAASPRRVTDSDEDFETNDFFFDLTQVYELVVIGGVLAYGHTDYEQRTLVKVLSERMTWALPTVLLASLAFNEGGSSPLVDFLMRSYTYFDEFV